MAFVYLDYAATTPVDDRVAERMAGCLTKDGVFANPSSATHAAGRRAGEAVEHARGQVAASVGADPREIVFTSGATEADNLAIKGVARFQRDRGRHIVTAASEHNAVLDACSALEFEGFAVTRVPPEPDGRVTPAAIEAALRPDTVLVSVMHANNETGVINDIAAIGRRVRQHGARFHVDAAQTGARLPLDTGELDVDLVSMSAHKSFGPKGIGALWVRRRPRVRLMPQLHGGGHERGLRPGTLATHQIVGMGEAFALAEGEREREREHAEMLRTRLFAHLDTLADVRDNGGGAPRLPWIRNVAFAGVEGAALAAALADRLALATGSACSSGSTEPSAVLRAMGQPAGQAAEAVRLSWGRMTTQDEMDRAGGMLADTVGRLRAGAAVA